MSNVKVTEDYYESNIAIIGMSGRFPSAPDLDRFWQNLRNGLECVHFFSDQELEGAGISPDVLRNPNYIKARAILEDIEYFDAAFFGFTPREAEVMNPQHRLLLECAWAAIESAGYNPDKYERPVGVYVGAAFNSHIYNVCSQPDLVKALGLWQIQQLNLPDHLSTFISYKLNLRGPSINVLTTCSTSLVAVHLACQSLLSGECDMALAGGAKVCVPQYSGYYYQEGGVNSADGHCRTFDASATGTHAGSGAGIVVLKRLTDALADRDTIHAIIRGSAINNDGSGKLGYTAPSVEGQAKVIAEALAVAGINAESIGYIEAHGTATPLGDPVEIAALSRAFSVSTQKRDFCAIGSVKTNIGHLDTAAGITGLIKTVLALKHKEIPPSLHFERPNPEIDFANSPFFVSTRLKPWSANGTPRRAGVSSFGIGGTNAHVIVEEAPPTKGEESGSRPSHLLTLSAKTNSALETATANLAHFLSRNPEVELADVAYTLQVGRKEFNFRRALACWDYESAIKALESPEEPKTYTAVQRDHNRTLCFMFPGQGSQHVQMGRGLYESERTFRHYVDLCSDLLKPQLGVDLRKVLFPNDQEKETSATRLAEASISHTSIFVIEYALAKLWGEWGIRPQAMIGHSLGEYVAACLAGVFDLEDALTLVATRGRLMQRSPTGAMLAVSLGEGDVYPLLDEGLSMAAINSPSSCVISGPTDAVIRLEERLTAHKINCTRIHASHAFHSAMMDQAMDEYKAEVGRVHMRPPHVSYISNLTGEWVSAQEATDPDYWTRHLRHTVRFSQGLNTLRSDINAILLEVGPGRVLTDMVKQNSKDGQVVMSSMRHPRDPSSDHTFLMGALGKLWLAGAPIDWSGLYVHERRRRTPLPTYPFERERYWVSQGEVDVRPRVAGHTPTLHPRQEQIGAYVAPEDILEQSIAGVWQEVIGIAQIGVHDNFFELGGHSLLALQVMNRLKESLQVSLRMQVLFENPTICELASVIRDVMSSELDQLSEEEAQRLLEG